MKLGRYVIVDDSGNYVMFHELNIHVKIKKIITPHNKSLSHLCSSAIQPVGLSKFVYLTMMTFSLDDYHSTLNQLVTSSRSSSTILA